MEERVFGGWETQENCEDLEKLVARGRLLHSQAVFAAFEKIVNPLRVLFGARAASSSAAEEALPAEDCEELIDSPLHSK